MAEYFYGITDKGKRREKNEDTFFARKIPRTALLVAGVVDGVGGYQGGDIAAEIARSVILESLSTISGDNVIQSLREAIVAANKKINEARQKEPGNELMACVLTCVVADKKNHTCWYAHVGDTRAWLLRCMSLSRPMPISLVLAADTRPSPIGGHELATEGGEPVEQTARITAIETGLRKLDSLRRRCDAAHDLERERRIEHERVAMGAAILGAEHRS